MRHDRFGNLTAIIDVDGSAMRLDYDEARRVVQVVERDGATWRYRYDGDDLVERVDPDGLSQRWAWDEPHRLRRVGRPQPGPSPATSTTPTHRAPTRVVGPDGAVVAQTLDERGLPLEIVDADGVVTSLALGRRRPAAGSDRRIRRGDRRSTTTPRGLPAPASRRRGVRRRSSTTTPAAGSCAPQRGDAVWEYGYTAAGRVCRRHRAGRHRLVGDVRRPRGRRDDDRRRSVDRRLRVRRHRQRHPGDRSRRRRLPPRLRRGRPARRRRSNPTGRRRPRSTTAAAGRSRSPTPGAACGGAASTPSAGPSRRRRPTARRRPSPTTPTGELASRDRRRTVGRGACELDAAGRPVAMIDPPADGP